MKWGDENENRDVLQNLEFSVVEIWRRQPEMTDWVALRAYEAAYQFYRSEQRGGTPRPSGLKGLDAEVYEAVKAVCEFRLGRGSSPELAQVPEQARVSESIPTIPLDKLLECLRELAKSVQRHIRLGGRQGYLTFIDRFLP
jgi:hypothetical protein